MSIGGIGSLFGRALDGLRTSSSAMNVTSNNIANVNTPGYARQIFVQGTRASSGNGLLGGGVVALGVTSFIDPFVERQLVNERSELGTYDGRRLIASNIENLLYEKDKEGVGSAITAFFNSWSELSQDASSGALRSNVRENGRLLADRLNSTQTQLQNMRRNLSGSIGTRVATVNSLSEQIASINDSIRSASDETAKLELKSERNVVLQKLADEVGINYFEAADETLTIQLVGTGLPLVRSNSSAVLSVSDDLSVGGTLTINSTIAGASSGSTVDVTSYISSGALGGSLTDRNLTLNDSIDDLNQLAYNIVTEVNAIHSTGYGLDGVDGRNFFAPLAGADNAASLISLDAGVLNNLDTLAAAEEDPAISGVGDSRIAMQLVGLSTALTMGGGTTSFSQFYSTMVSDAGISAGQINQRVAAQEILVSKLQQQRDNVSGVNLDEEAADLLKYQRAFQGSARVMSIANDMLDTLLQL